MLISQLTLLRSIETLLYILMFNELFHTKYFFFYIKIKQATITPISLHTLLGVFLCAFAVVLFCYNSRSSNTRICV